jgi:signal transduction histidine kinase
MWRAHEQFRFRRRVGESSREQHARLYLMVARPGILLAGVLTSVVDVLLRPGSVSETTWLVMLCYLALQAPYMLMARSLAIRGVVTASLVVDGVVMLAAIGASEAPASRASATLLLVIGISYFATPRVTIAYGIGLATAVSIVGPTFDGWDVTTPISAAAFTIVIASVVLAMLNSQMRRTERELADTVSSQREALERLEQVDRARDRLIANVSHELRTPLTATIGSIETLLRADVDLDPAQRQGMLELARDGGRRLLALVEDLLAVGTTRPDSLELTPEPELLASLVTDAVAGIDPGTGRELRRQLEVDVLVRVDRMRMLQVVTNLVVNVIRHGEGDIVVTTDADEEHARIRVCDEGPGIRPEHLDELFLPFARFSTRTDSTGLGLAICRALVEAHGGQIDYSRTTDDRTCFTVSLPLDVNLGAGAGATMAG